ncbi:unnamed protein product [Effrenium voratum]|nr:unnamed protein product [Effrenium voratum]
MWPCRASFDFGPCPVTGISLGLLTRYWKFQPPTRKGKTPFNVWRLAPPGVHRVDVPHIGNSEMLSIYKEVQIHGELSLKRNVQRLVAARKYRDMNKMQRSFGWAPPRDQSGPMELAQYELRFVLPPGTPAREALEAARSGREELFPKGPAHVSLGKFSCGAELEAQKVQALEDLCRSLRRPSILVQGHCLRRRNGAQYLPVNAEGALFELRNSGLFDSFKEPGQLHVSMGKAEAFSLPQCWCRVEGLTLLKLRPRSRDFLGCWDLALGDE